MKKFTFLIILGLVLALVGYAKGFDFSPVSGGSGTGSGDMVASSWVDTNATKVWASSGSDTKIPSWKAFITYVKNWFAPKASPTFTGTVGVDVITATGAVTGASFTTPKVQSTASTQTYYDDCGTETTGAVLRGPHGHYASSYYLDVPLAAGTLLADSSITGHNISAARVCSAVDGNTTVATCTTTPSFPPVTGDSVMYKSGAANTGAFYLRVNGMAKTEVKKRGTISLVAGDIATTPYTVLMTYDGTYWEMEGQGAKAILYGSDGNMTIASFAWDGGNATITDVPNNKVCAPVAFAGTITHYVLVTGPVGSPATTSIAMTKCSNFTGASISCTDFTTNNPVTSTANFGNYNSVLTGWTTTVLGNDVLCAEMTANDAAKRATLKILGHQ